MSKMWYMQNGKEGDIVLSTRVRLARNLSDFPSPVTLHRKSSEVVDVVASAMASSDVGNDFKLIDMTTLTELERLQLVEKHLIS